MSAVSGQRSCPYFISKWKSLAALTMSGLLGLASTSAAAKKERQPSGAGYPDAFVTYLQDGSRFKNPQYFHAMAADGIATADPKAIYAVLQRSLSAEENYKALYLARVFTKVRPDLSSGWLNRANIASSLGFDEEAASASKRAGMAATDVVREALPGNSGKVRPVDLQDWAASLMLVADGTTRFGPNLLVAVEDDISGVHSEISQSSPSVRAADIKAADLGPNLFFLQRATPMKFKSENAGSSWGSTLMALTSGLASANGDINTATQAADQAGRLSAEAAAVSFHYTGGKYEEVRCSGAKPLVTLATPKATGEFSVIRTPVPVLAASGSPQGPTVTASFSTLRTAEFSRIRASHPTALPAKYKASGSMTLQFPRLLAIGRNLYFTPAELLLTAQDIRELFPLLGPQQIDLAQAQADYRAGRLEFSPDNCKLGLAGYDEAGNLYSTHLSPDHWLVGVATLPDLSPSGDRKYNPGKQR